MTVGERIKKNPARKRIVTKRIRRKTWCFSTMIGQWETGKANPKIETKKKIADALNIHLSDLIDDFNELPQNEILSDLGKDTVHELAMKMVEKLQNIEDENGMLNQDLLEKELDSIIEIATKAGAANKALLNAEIKQCMDKMLTLILKLNDTGRKEAIKRVTELTKLSEYMGVDLNILLKPEDEPPTGIIP